MVERILLKRKVPCVDKMRFVNVEPCGTVVTAVLKRDLHVCRKY